METIVAVTPLLIAIAKVFGFLTAIASIVKLWLEERRPTDKSNPTDN